MAPSFAVAQHHPTKAQQQKDKNNWRNLSIAGGALGVIGLLKHNALLTELGIGGGLYSVYRYEQDRKGQSKVDRRRAALFSHTRIKQNGHWYNRKTVTRNGHKYFAFVKAK